jgi:ABC-type lipoprotein export system ATPase subunit
LHLIAALDRPTSGSVRVNGRDVGADGSLDDYRRTQVGLVFQLHNLLPHLSASENVTVAMIGADGSPRAHRARAQELLEGVGLAKKGRLKPPKLSGGERQRVAIARALANGPAVVLADEPTGALDSAATALVLELFGKVRAEQGVSILMVTHDMQVAAAADRTVYMRDGRVLPEDAGAAATRPAAG